MRIVLIGPTYPYRGGISHYTTLLCKELQEKHKVKLISFKRQYPKLLYPGRTDIDPSESPIKINCAEYIIDSINPATWFKAAREIIKYNPQKIILNWWVTFWAAQFFTIIKLLKSKTSAELVIICHNVVEHESNFIKKLATKIILAQSDRLVTHSKEETSKCIKMLGENINVLTAFHPTYKDLTPERLSKHEAKTKLGIKGNCLLFFGFVRKYKGLDVLIEAVRKCKGKKVTLMIVGEFWKDKSKYIEQIDRLGLSSQTRIIDEYIPNESLSLYFCASDLVVQPYLSASGSGICQIAYGFDRPVIATNVGSLPEVIKDGINGRLVKPGSAAELAEAIDKSLQVEELEKLTENAVKTKEEFSWKKLAKMLTQEEN